MSQQERIKIQVTFYFETTEYKNERLEMARDAITIAGDGLGVILSEQSIQLTTSEQYIILALMSFSTVFLHHAFDSLLNKSYPDGVGAGELIEIQ